MIRFSIVLVLVLGLISGSFAVADDHEPPFVAGEYWEVTGIKLEDGGGLKYAKWLASEWRKNSDFAVSKGWLNSYQILSNVHPRSDEADIYIIRMFNSLPDAAEDEKRRVEYMEWSRRTMEEMQEESGNRAEYRTVMSSSLLRAENFRD